MKKNEITMVRLLSLAVLMILSVLILLIPVGSNEFGSIINKMNNNSLKISETQNSVYNLYYYTGLNVLYQMLYSLSILFATISIVGVLLRLGNTGRIAAVAAVFNILTGLFLLFARIWESSASMHAWIDSFYIDGVNKAQIDTVQLLDRVPVLYILLIILGMLQLLMIKSSGIMKLKMFAKNNKTDAFIMVVPALFTYLWAGFIRQNILLAVVKNGDTMRMTISDYLGSYYIGNKIFFNWSWMVMLLIATVLCIVVNSEIMAGINKKIKLLISIEIPVLATIVPSVIYAFNPPALFGYLTLDIALCDMTDNAFYVYLAAFSVSLTAAYILIYMVVRRILKIKTYMWIFIINVVISIILMIIVSAKSSLAIQYMPWIVADCVSVVLAVVSAVIKPVDK